MRHSDTSQATGFATAARASGDPRPRPPRRQAAGGFTLLELVLVVALIAILGSLGASIYAGYVEEARIHRAIQEIRNIELFVSDFASDRGFFPENLADVGADEMLDPWGNAYQYLNIANALKGGKGKQRKDKFLVPVNSDFDLYSMGPDGASVPPFTGKAARDDIVRANNGGFVGVAEQY